jgi:UPF0271 protein
MIINCDMGEGIGNETEIMPFIDAANIACGYHAGNEETMREAIGLCIKFGVSIGAHPSFPDKENFGRTDMQLPASEVYRIVKEQLAIINNIAGSTGNKIKHVKPHGALYNMSAKNKELARAIATAVKDFDDSLLLMGLSGSFSIEVAKQLGLRVANEVFADRTYQDDGSLTPRKEPHALITDAEQLTRQVLQMANEQMVTTVSGKLIPLIAETICIHGDGSHAVEFAKIIFHVLKQKA